MYEYNTISFMPKQDGIIASALVIIYDVILVIIFIPMLLKLTSGRIKLELFTQFSR